MRPFKTRMDLLRYKYQVPAFVGKVVRHQGRLVEIRGCVNLNQLIIRFCGTETVTTVHPYDLDYHWNPQPKRLLDKLMALNFREVAA